jgi:hypothetical protein
VLSSRRAAAVVFCAVASLSLVACDANQVGAAAVVGGERITVTEVQDEARAVAELAGTEPTGDQSSLQRAILQSKIQHQLLLEVGDETGVSVSDAQIDQVIADQYRAQAPDGDITGLLVQNSITEDGFRMAIHNQLLYNEIVGQVGDEVEVAGMLDAAVADLDIEVNPRYGVWDGLSLNAEQSGSVSVPAGVVDLPEPLDLD